MGGISKIFTGLFGGGDTPDPPAPVLPPTKSDAAPAGGTARRAATARGRAATIITGELGVLDGNPNQRKKLLGVG